MIGMTVCSGIGAPERAAPWIDWRYQSEIEPFPCAVLKEHFPDAVNLGDMTKFKGWPDANIDVLCGGTPCQSFSIAGLRKGLADPRGNLALTYLAIAERYRPRWLVWENVPGVLSALSHEAPDQSPPDIDLDSDDGPRDGEEIVVTDEYTSVESHALWCFMAGAAELNYHGGFIHLDAQYIQTPGFARAVPQRRDRLFFVGYLGDWRRAAAVLFDRESLCGHPPPRREAGKNVAPTVSARPSAGGGLGTDFDCGGGLVPETARSLRAQPQLSHREDQDTLITSHDAAPCLTARERKGALPEADFSAVVAHTLKAEGFDASEDGTGRGTPIVPVAFDCKGTEVQVSEDGSHPPLRSMGHHNSHQSAGGHAAVAFDTTQVTSPGNFSNPKPGDPCHPPAAGAHPPAVAFDMRGREGGAMPEGPHDTASVRAASGGSSRSYVAVPWAVRRLTPTECERLMGFPDDWTAIPWRNRPAEKCPDGPRYKALGNSWAVNSGQYIFERIRMVEELFASQDSG
ncbi:DNA cytosine methyltransferase [Ruegeria sp. EL01]|uniref:DNA cytosine methyltransferase n=1 Tax=Ruegeria sp. EL01 TaxID=2107578 RepID=UPI001C1F8903|nr:DNA cytosine methyltransferase [Ruegeria sp. EL01]